MQPYTCQLCENTDLDPILFLGMVPGVNALTPIGSPASSQMRWPLELARCPGCGLVQLTSAPPPHQLFPQTYPYRSRVTGILRDNFEALCASAIERLQLKPDALVIDIGSNDGTLLAPFARAGMRVLGVEPTDAAQDATAQGIETLQAFFTPELAREIRQKYGPASLVTATNVFAHMPRPLQLAHAIVSLLHEGGVFVSESHYLGDLLQTCQYDTIYHEHLRYYSLGSLVRLIAHAGLHPFDVERIPTHGGSIRLWTGKGGPGHFPPQSTLVQLAIAEQKQGIESGQALGHLARDAARARDLLWQTVSELKMAGRQIAGIGAPSRASTLLLFSGLDHLHLRCIYEVTGSPKIGHWMPGTRIEVRDEEEFFRDPPDVALLLSWHLADTLIPTLRRKGFNGTFLVPLPVPRQIEPGDPA